MRRLLRRQSDRAGGLCGRRAARSRNGGRTETRNGSYFPIVAQPTGAYEMWGPLSVVEKRGMGEEVDRLSAERGTCGFLPPGVWPQGTQLPHPTGCPPRCQGPKKLTPSQERHPGGGLNGRSRKRTGSASAVQQWLRLPTGYHGDEGGYNWPLMRCHRLRPTASAPSSRSSNPLMACCIGWFILS